MLVQRYERAVLSNNKTLINLISTEIKSEIPRMRPIELVNAAKLSRSESLTHAILAECKRRKYEKFKSQDFATLVSVGAKSDDFRNAVSINMRSMRTSDLCFVLWKLNAQTVSESGLNELASRDLTRLTQTNLTQLLRVMACSRSAIPLALVDSVVSIWINLMPTIDNKAFPFVLYSLAETVSKQRFESSSKRLDDFFALANSELVRRTDMECVDVIDSVRALGRIRRLEREVFESRLVCDTLDKVDVNSLSEVRRKGIQNAAVSVGLTSFSF
jgi:hypothetical protein